MSDRGRGTPGGLERERTFDFPGRSEDIIASLSQMRNDTLSI
jgi:hypothetical protein